MEVNRLEMCAEDHVQKKDNLNTEKTKPQEALYRKNVLTPALDRKINSSQIICLDTVCSLDQRIKERLLEPVEFEEEFRRRQAKIHLFLIITCLICAFQNARISCQLYKQKLEIVLYTEKEKKNIPAYMQFIFMIL